VSAPRFVVTRAVIATTRAELVVAMGGDPAVDDVDEEAIVGAWVRAGHAVFGTCERCRCAVRGAEAEMGARRWAFLCFECALFEAWKLDEAATREPLVDGTGCEV
jgi:hypothetical protein